MQEARLIAGRYRIVRPLGRGGNALVHEVVDETNGATLALKALSVGEAGRQHVRDLFRREFNTLAQLSHPLIVRVFDYGVDETPYYTMELLSGQILRGPIPWLDVCTLLRDVASALSLVHSRRLVHRDVSHRNVHRTDDGHGKLFDFGALAPIGPTTDVVGTPPYIAPEAVAGQRIDARSDLFSLGALAYLLLTGRHAFPSRRIADLGDAWRRTIEVPSRFASDVPKALDELVVSLISINPVARPASAAEVFDRLTAIGSLPAAEAPEVAQAYLTTPALVGRAAATAHFSKMLARVKRGRGGSAVLEGQRGLGRSRLLSSLLLDGKLDGFLTLRADAASADPEPFGVARALAKQLLAADPAVARDAAGSNAELLAKILFGNADTVVDDASSASIVEALTSMIVRAADSTPIVVGVDDFERADAFSKQFLIRLAGAAQKAPVVVLFTLIQNADTEAHGLLRGLSQAMVLSPLSEPETQKLVSSLFGDVANVDTVAIWVHRLSGGRPRTALEAATHLVDAGIARFVEGSWILPAGLEDLVLPARIEQALDARIALLSVDARGLCQALALSAPDDPLLFDEYPELAPGVSGGRLDAAVNELVARSVVGPSGEAFAFVHEGVREAAERSIPDGGHRDIHRRVSAGYASGATPSFILAAHHALQAGDVEAAFVHAVRALHRWRAVSVRGAAFMRTLPGTASMERLFEWGLANRKQWPSVTLIGYFLLQLSSVGELGLVRHREPVLARLRLDSGLSDWEELSEIGDPLERVRAAVERAFERHFATPEAERGLPPLEAIEMLCGAAAGLTGLFVRRAETREVKKLLPLLEPFRPLSPAVSAVADLVALTVRSLLGCFVHDERARVLQALSSPIPGLDEGPRLGMYWLTIYYQALEDAMHGHPDASVGVSLLTETATYAPLAWEVRLVEALYHGNLEAADAARKERDLSKLTKSTELDAHLESAFGYEATAFEHLGDLLRLKRCLPWLEERSRVCPNVRVSYQLHVGNYHRLRGELPKALAAYERAFEHASSPEDHAEYAYLAMRYGQTLTDCGRAEEAKRFLDRVIPICDVYGIMWLTQTLLMLSLAGAEAALGLTDQAVERSERARAVAEDNGLGGIFLVVVYREQARVADLAGDEGLFERTVVRLEHLAATSKHAAFATKHAHLLRHAQGRGKFEVAPNPQKSLDTPESTHTSLVVAVRTQIELCRGRSERAQKALKILLHASSSDEGFLFLCNTDRLELAASSASEPPPASLEAALVERVRASTDGADTTSDSTVLTSLRPRDAAGHFDVVEVITESGGRVVLAALAAMKPRKELLDPVPMILRSALSDALLSAGDASGIPWA